MQWPNFINIKKYDREKTIALIKLILAFALTLPLIISHFLMFAEFSDYSWMMGLEWYAVFAITFVQFGLGYQYYVWAYQEMFVDKRLGMSTLIMFSTLISYVWSFVIFILTQTGTSLDFNNDGHSDYMSFFEVGGSVIAFALLGSFISDQLYKNVNSDIEALVKLQVDQALLYNLKSKKTTQIAGTEIKAKDYLLVKNNTRIPADAKLINESTYVNEVILTGEAKPVLKKVGDIVYAGTINFGNNIIIQALTDNSKTVLTSIINKVTEIKESQPKIEKLADRISMWFTPVVLSLAIIAFIVNFFVGYDIQNGLGVQNWNDIPHFVTSSHENYALINSISASFFSIAMIAIACPCALGLATPLAVVIGLGIASKNHIVYNTKEIFEKIKHLNAIAFDKTGTLTVGKLVVTDTTDKKHTYADIVYSLENQSIHPLAQSLVSYLEPHKKQSLKLTSFKEEIGFGVKATYKTNTFTISSFSKLINLGFKTKLSVPAVKADMTYLALAKDKEIVAIYSLKDTLNPNAKEVIGYLQRNNITTYMITGDSQQNAKLIADQLGLDHYFAQTKPDDKGKIIDEIKKQGKVVAYVGDGVNDLIALKKADLAISVSLTNESAKEVADLNIVNGDILNIYKAIKITKLTRRAIIWNLIWAFGYNIITIPLAFIGIVPMIVAPIAMGFSDVSLILNTLFYKSMINRQMKKMSKY